MSTKQENMLDPHSCLNKAALDEPIFILRANDATSAPTIIAWAARYLHSKGGWQQMSMTQRAKYNEALAVAASMDEWRKTSFDDDIPF